MATTPATFPQAQGAGTNPGLNATTNAQYATSSFTYPLALGEPGMGLDHYMLFNIDQNVNSGFTTQSINGQAPTGLATVNNNAALDAALGIASGGSSPISRVATAILLYMPPNLVEQYTNDWGAQTEIGFAEDLVGREKSEADTAKSLGVSTLRAVGHQVGGITNLNLNAAAGYAAHVAINNHRELLYDGPEFRQFTFQFRFVPQSVAEATNIYNIITAFKFYAAPEIMVGSGGRYWLYPAEFDISFWAHGVQNSWLGQISTCALVDIIVNYSPVGEWAAHRLEGVGAPGVCTELSLTFREVEFMTKRRILEGF